MIANKRAHNMYTVQLDLCLFISFSQFYLPVRKAGSQKVLVIKARSVLLLRKLAYTSLT